MPLHNLLSRQYKKDRRSTRFYKIPYKTTNPKLHSQFNRNRFYLSTLRAFRNPRLRLATPHQNRSSNAISRPDRQRLRHKSPARTAKVLRPQSSREKPFDRSRPCAPRPFQPLTPAIRSQGRAHKAAQPVPIVVGVGTRKSDTRPLTHAHSSRAHYARSAAPPRARTRRLAGPHCAARVLRGAWAGGGSLVIRVPTARVRARPLVFRGEVLDF